MTPLCVVCRAPQPCGDEEGARRWRRSRAGRRTRIDPILDDSATLPPQDALTMTMTTTRLSRARWRVQTRTAHGWVSRAFPPTGLAAVAEAERLADDQQVAARVLLDRVVYYRTEPDGGARTADVEALAEAAGTL